MSKVCFVVMVQLYDCNDIELQADIGYYNINKGTQPEQIKEDKEYDESCNCNSNDSDPGSRSVHSESMNQEILNSREQRGGSAHDDEFDNRSTDCRSSGIWCIYGRCTVRKCKNRNMSIRYEKLIT